MSEFWEAASRTGVLLLLLLILATGPSALNAHLFCGPSDFSRTETGAGISVISDEDDPLFEVLGCFYVPWTDHVHLFEDQKIVAVDREEGDRFGRSVGLSGNRALIGAYRDDDYGNNSGSSYLYCFDGAEWIEEEKLHASDGEAWDFFGWAVSIADDVAVIGAYGDDDLGSCSGSAYIFSFDGTEWVEEQKLLPSDGQAWNYFGRAVCASGDATVIGSWGDDELGSNSGSAFVFRDNGMNWEEETKLLASDGEAEDRFGRSVYICGDIVVIGAWGDDDLGTDSGSAYIYRFNNVTWEEEAKLLASDGEAFDRFGYAVSVSDDVVIVGAYGDDDSGSWSGSGYIYRYNGSLWVEEEKLLASDGTRNDNFGRSVSVSGDIIVVGALFDDPSGPASGSAYLYRKQENSWVEEAKLLPSDGDTNDWYSYSLIVSDNVALIGALYNDDIYIDTGAAYVFEIGESNGMTPTPDVNDKERSGRTTGILRPEAKSEPAAAVRFAE